MRERRGLEPGSGAVLRELPERALRNLVYLPRSLLLPAGRRSGCSPSQPGDAASAGAAGPQPLSEIGPPGAQSPRIDACSRAGSAPSSLTYSRAVPLYCAGAGNDSQD